MNHNQHPLRHYLTITGNYWAFTLTDGAIRMLVVLYFHQLGYPPFSIAMLFLFYEFFGVVTNLVGGWIGARLGLTVTMLVGTALQIVALSMLAVDPAWLSVPYVMAAQALSGIAKDLNKMSAKASVKLLPTTQDHDNRLFRWVAVLTGSKNALKGIGFFLGGLLLSVFGFRAALLILAGGLLISLVITALLLPRRMGKSAAKPKFSHILSTTPAINRLSAARFFLFGSRDVWFVVALPVFLSSVLGWQHIAVGTALALWVIGYGVIQALAPRLLGKNKKHAPTSRDVLVWTSILAMIPAAIALGLGSAFSPAIIVIIGLGIFGVVFALNSSLHSFLILAYSDRDKIALNVGFYYMSNAAGRLVGTVLSGWAYQTIGLGGCLWISSAFVIAAALLTARIGKLETRVTPEVS